MNADKVDFAIKDGEGLTFVIFWNWDSKEYWSFAMLDGDEGYQVERDEQSFRVDGGVTTATLANDCLSLKLSASSARVLSCPEEVQISLARISDGCAGALAALKHILGDKLTVAAAN